MKKINIILMTDQELKDLVASLAIKSDHADQEMRELRESQRQTDEQMKKTDEQMKKTDEQMKKIGEKIDRLGKLFGDSSASLKEFRKSRSQTDEEFEKARNQAKIEAEERGRKIDEKLDRLGKLFGDFGNNRGEEVEDFFYRYFAQHPQMLGVSFDQVTRNVVTSNGDEHDIVMVNGNVAALISVKFKLHKHDVDKLVTSELQRVQHFFHKLGSKHRLLGGVASYIVSDDIKKYAEDRGLYVITRSGDNTIFLNREGFEAKAF